MKLNITSQLKKFLPYLIKAKEDGLHEADTSQIVSKILDDVLGYNPLTEITHELAVKGRYADMAIKIDSEIQFFIEIKSADTNLKDRHTDQARLYASDSGIHWVLLTNGFKWNLYYLTFEEGEGIDYQLIFAVDLIDEPMDKAAEMIFLLHRNSIKAGLHEEYRKEKNALGAESIGRAIFTEEVIHLVRKKIRQREHIMIGSEELAKAIHDLFTQDAQLEIGPAKIRAKRLPNAKIPAATPPAAATEAPKL